MISKKKTPSDYVDDHFMFVVYRVNFEGQRHAPVSGLFQSECLHVSYWFMTHQVFVLILVWLVMRCITWKNTMVFVCVFCVICTHARTRAPNRRQPWTCANYILSIFVCILLFLLFFFLCSLGPLLLNLTLTLRGQSDLHPQTTRWETDWLSVWLCTDRLNLRSNVQLLLVHSAAEPWPFKL